MKETKIKDIVDYYNPHISLVQVEMLLFMGFASFMCIISVATSTKLNPDHVIRNSVLAVSGLWTLAFCLYYNMFEKLFSKIGNIAIFKGDEDDN